MSVARLHDETRHGVEVGASTRGDGGAVGRHDEVEVGARGTQSRRMRYVRFVHGVTSGMARSTLPNLPGWAKKA